MSQYHMNVIFQFLMPHRKFSRRPADVLASSRGYAYPRLRTTVLKVSADDEYLCVHRSVIKENYKT
jgi:hypothetical protein